MYTYIYTYTLSIQDSPPERVHESTNNIRGGGSRENKPMDWWSSHESMLSVTSMATADPHSCSDAYTTHHVRDPSDVLLDNCCTACHHYSSFITRLDTRYCCSLPFHRVFLLLMARSSAYGALFIRGPIDMYEKKKVKHCCVFFLVSTEMKARKHAHKQINQPTKRTNNQTTKTNKQTGEGRQPTKPGTSDSGLEQARTWVWACGCFSSHLFLTPPSLHIHTHILRPQTFRFGGRIGRGWSHKKTRMNAHTYFYFFFFFVP